ncbi:MarR family transcriptional regulator [Mycobacterium sp. ITM-2016-00316]|uniref:MarR family transcriptional regulator n=1 Tax=Mycobacterium sp. ITM-2016-00316 TaxID=2099695 RepID=UPI000CF898A2|nr:MarR family transcriptional regulator [Mycobacterium sp. ITM-2016-00316]WNG82434.1 MarR family transcriptional regulator [Mycobacterium sp. ITM-2016-00316]
MERQLLHRLGRRLVELSRQVELAPGDVRPDPAEELIIGDVMFHPESTVGDVVARTGFAQSYVSKCVARLEGRGLLVTAVDESDRRRTIIGPSPMLQGASRRRTPPLATVLKEELGTEAEARRVLVALEELADTLLD